jgi:hypothetical protein
MQINVKDYVGQLFYGPAPFADSDPVNIAQTGSGPFNLILLGVTFGGGDPTSTITTQPGCRLIELGDAWQNHNKPSTQIPDQPDPVTDEVGGYLSNGLDHLRQLDLEDIKVQGITGGSTAAN